MAVVKELIRCEADGTLSFGDYTLNAKTKKEDFEYQGDLYKVKTYNEITKLEKNGEFVYESVPGTAVENFKATEEEITFAVTGVASAMITVGAEADSDYVVYVNDVNIGDMKTGISAKVNISTELGEEKTMVRVVRK